MEDSLLEQTCVTTLRMLAIDAVEQADSGHPGLPLGADPMAYVLATRLLRHHPQRPDWPDRDRFILSAGHGSALLYSLLHLCGYPLPLDEVKRFRQLGSRTPGHPEYGHTPGVECTTGPLGQGFAMGVGMALAERQLAHRFNRPGFEIVNHYTYALVSDGDLMEGVAAEAAALAGHLQLGKLIYLYDDNQITIEGATSLAFSEDVTARFHACGWQVLEVANGEDLTAIEQALHTARAATTQPSLIRVHTRIGHGSPKAGTSGVHGSPLTGAAMDHTRDFFNWPATRFHIPPEVSSHLATVAERGAALENAWHERFAAYRAAHPELAAEFADRIAGRLPTGWDDDLPTDFGPKPVATRVASGICLNALAPRVPGLIGGSADLAPSNNTWLKPGPLVEEGRNLRFGVREHAMAAISNGLALHGGFIPYCATFLVFSDYLRGALRLSALMGVRVIYVFTHDSIAVGEDGPTHQPVEHLASLRVIPGLQVLRPADARETAAAWRVALAHSGPTALILSRQNLPQLSGELANSGVAAGGYTLRPVEEPHLLLLATGSEVSLAVAAAERLSQEGVRAAVVSLPSWERFARQEQGYRDRVLPPTVTHRLAIEAGVAMGWERWVGATGEIISMDGFGASGPGMAVMDHFGFALDNVVARARRMLKV